MHISPSFHGDKIVVPGGLGFAIGFLQCFLPPVSIWTMVILPRAKHIRKWELVGNIVVYIGCS